uniref:Uncharacterized protein n=1 Tax=Anopheles albimanus TaxID=7167 RepID=A0A182FFI5_ANOAL
MPRCYIVKKQQPGATVLPYRNQRPPTTAAVTTGGVSSTTANQHQHRQQHQTARQVLTAIEGQVKEDPIGGNGRMPGGSEAPERRPRNGHPVLVAGTAKKQKTEASNSSSSSSSSALGNVMTVESNGVAVTAGKPGSHHAANATTTTTTTTSHQFVLLNSVSVISGGPAARGGAPDAKTNSIIDSGNVGFVLATAGGATGTGNAGITTHQQQHQQQQQQQRKDVEQSSGPVSPTEGCVAPIYYTNISDNKSAVMATGP